MEDRTIREMKEDILARLLNDYNNELKRSKWWMLLKIHRLINKRDYIIKKIGDLYFYGN